MQNAKEQRMHWVTVYILLWIAHFLFHFILNRCHQILLMSYSASLVNTGNTWFHTKIEM